MPAKNSLKQYIPGGFYHLYNRGVEKRIIFQDEQDFSVFLGYLKEYLLPKNEDQLRQNLNRDNLSSKEKARLVNIIHLNNFADEIDLLAFCLMPNHFHLLLRQEKPDSIDRFMNSLCTRYTMYFNKKYKRVGKLFQGVYKAVLVEVDEYLLHLTRYIHCQAQRTRGRSNYPSSLDAYLGKVKIDWINIDEVLNYFSRNQKTLTYEAFLYQEDECMLGVISSLFLE